MPASFARRTRCLDRSAVITDAVSRTTAASVSINEKSGELRAAGGVTSTYLAAAKSNQSASAPARLIFPRMPFPARPIRTMSHIRAVRDSGGAILSSMRIRLISGATTRSCRQTGHVVAVFSAGFGPVPPFPPPRRTKSSKLDAPPAGPTLWKIRCAISHLLGLTRGKRIWKAGSLQASQPRVAFTSRTLDVFLQPRAGSPKAAAWHTGRPPGRGWEGGTGNARGRAS